MRDCSRAKTPAGIKSIRKIRWSSTSDYLLVERDDSLAAHRVANERDDSLASWSPVCENDVSERYGEEERDVVVHAKEVCG